MADVTIDGTVVTATARGMRSVVFITPLIGYCFYLDGDGVFGYSKTTDGGATWGAQVNVDNTAATTVVAYDVWFDKWTPGDNGTLIHCWFFDVTADDVFYRTLDTNGDILGTQQTVIAATSAVAGRGAFVSGTKTRSGYLYCAYDIDAGAERGLHRSTDGGATWSTNLATTFVEATLDQCKLFPASNTGDNNDCWAIYYDASATALTIKMWDSSAGAEVESATIQTHTDGATDLTGQYGFDGSVRHSDGHLIVAAVSLRDNASSVHNVYDVTDTSTITTKGNITSSIDDHYYPQVFIDQATGAIYIAYNGKRDGSETLDTASKVYYTKSTDGGSTWSVGDIAYQEGAAGVVQQVWTPLMGQKFYVAWRVSTTLIGNAVNSLTMPLYTSLTEGLKLFDATPSFPLSVSVNETLHLSDVGGGTVHLLGNVKSSETINVVLFISAIPEVEVLHITDSVGAALQLAVSLEESLKFSEISTPVLTPLVVSLTAEQLKISEIATADVQLSVSIFESLKFTDVVTPALIDLGALAVNINENLHLTDGGTIHLVGNIHGSESASVLRQETDLSVSLSETLVFIENITISINLSIELAEVLKVIENLTISENLAVQPLETLILSESISVFITPLLVSTPDETLRLTDNLNLGLDLSAGIVESLKVTEDFNTTLDLAITLTENLHIPEGPASLSLGNNLAVSLSEVFHITDVGGGSVHLIGNIHIIDSATVVQGGNDLFSTLSEVLRITEVVTTARTPLETSISEILHFQDAVESYVERLEVEAFKVSDIIVDIQLVTVGAGVQVNETFHITETIAAAMQLVVNVDEALKFAETITSSIQLVVEANETLRLTDDVTSSLTPLFISLNEALHAVESISEIQRAEFGGLTVSISEDLKFSETAIVVLPELVTNLNEAIKFVDTLLIVLNLAVQVQEQLVLLETVEANNPLLTIFLQEELKLSEVYQGGIDLLSTAVEEQLKFIDYWFAQVGNAGTLDVVGTYSTVIDTVGTYSNDVDLIGFGVE